MELKNTIDLMNSADYKERFLAEYQQLAIRYQKLCAMVEKWDAGVLPFAPTCPKKLYDLQIRAMSDYLAALEARAAIENVSLFDSNDEAE